MDAKKISILSAVAASSCCLPPLILLGLTLVGVGTAGFAGFSSTMGALKWYIFPMAIAGLILSYYLYFREKKRCSGTACKMANEKFTKTMLSVSTIVIIGFFAWSVYPYVLGSEFVLANDVQSSAHLAVFEVNGMTCGGCEIAVNGVVEATGVADSVKASFTESKAYIWYSDPETDMTTFTDAISTVGYDAILVEVQ